MKEFREKQFHEEQIYQFFVAVIIIALSLILKPGTQQDDRVTIFGFKTPVICMHRLIFNKPCAGCGLTRSFVSFAHGDFEAAYNYHRLGIPLFILVLFQIPIRIYLLKTGLKGYTKFIKKLIFYPAVIVIFALLINWIVYIWQTSFSLT